MSDDPSDKQEVEDELTKRAYSQAIDLLRIYGDRDGEAADLYWNHDDASQVMNTADLPVSALAHLLAWAGSYPKVHTREAADHICMTLLMLLPKIAADFDRELVRKGLR